MVPDAESVGVLPGRPFEAAEPMGPNAAARTSQAFAQEMHLLVQRMVGTALSGSAEEAPAKILAGDDLVGSVQKKEQQPALQIRAVSQQKAEPSLRGGVRDCAAFTRNAAGQRGGRHPERPCIHQDAAVLRQAVRKPVGVGKGRKPHGTRAALGQRAPQLVAAQQRSVSDPNGRIRLRI